jgi:hypothetical protein
MTPLITSLHLKLLTKSRKDEQFWSAMGSAPNGMTHLLEDRVVADVRCGKNPAVVKINE